MPNYMQIAPDDILMFLILMPHEGKAVDEVSIARAA
jgi:hypothetical protein